eukprot:SAG22_NODE_942_length_6401_cov_9.094000_6_plen_306_part_00
MLRGHPAVTFITMSSYAANQTRFENVVDKAMAVASTGAGGPNPIPVYTCGMSCASGTPGYGVTSTAAVDARFTYLEQKGVSSVSIFGDWREGSNDSLTLLESFAPRMRKFLQGKRPSSDEATNADHRAPGPPSPPPPPFMPPNSTNFTLSIGPHCLAASANHERAPITLAACANNAPLQIWRTNQYGMLFLSTMPKPTCAKPIGDCNRTVGARAWLGQMCVIPAHIFALERITNSGGGGGVLIRLPFNCDQASSSSGHIIMCLRPESGGVSLALALCPSGGEGWTLTSVPAAETTTSKLEVSDER